MLYQNKIPEQEFVAEFDYSPTACSNIYRIILLQKQVTVVQEQQTLFGDSP
jgi:hypothetical protein